MKSLSKKMGSGENVERGKEGRKLFDKYQSQQIEVKDAKQRGVSRRTMKGGGGKEQRKKR